MPAVLMMPADFDSTRKYPLLLHVYGGPGSATVNDAWGSYYLWHLMLTQRGYVVASLDNRGTPAPRGREFRKVVYRKVGTVTSGDQAAALQGWDLPDAFQHLRHLLEARMGNRGKREFIQVLRLMEAMPQTIVTAAVTEAIRLGAIGFDAVKLIALARLERRPARLDLAACPHLPRPAVRTTSAADYTALVRPVAA